MTEQMTDTAQSDRADAPVKSPSRMGDEGLDRQEFGKFFIDEVYRILKVASIYDVDHNQTQEAIAEFLPDFEQSVAQIETGTISVTIRGELCSVNGETLRLRRREQERLDELQGIFADAHIRGIMFEEGMTAEDLSAFLTELNTVTSQTTDDDSANMKHVDVPNIQLDHGAPDQTIMEAVARVDKGMYIAHVYMRALVKVSSLHEEVRSSADPDVHTDVVRRILQTISELLSDEDFTILGLLPMRLVAPDVSSHSVNTAIYSMLLADRLGLNQQMVAYVGMAVIYQDIDRLAGISVGHRDRDPGLDTHRQFSANMRDVAEMFQYCDGDIVSTLRILLTYERGCPYDEKVGRPFYRKERDLHLISRIIDLCRTYDLLIQGLQGYKSRRPDLAVQYIESRSGEVFDPPLVDLLVSTLGMYPVGTTVQLTSGERGVVIRTPDPTSEPDRPAVRLMGQQNQTVIDLSDDQFQHIEIAQSIDIDEVADDPTDVFLLT